MYAGGQDGGRAPELAGDDLEVGAGLQGQARRRVVEIMEPDRRQACGLGEALVSCVKLCGTGVTRFMTQVQRDSAARSPRLPPPDRGGGAYPVKWDRAVTRTAV